MFTGNRHHVIRRSIVDFQTTRELAARIAGLAKTPPVMGLLVMGPMVMGLMLVIGLAGCSSSPSPLDPVFGRSTVALPRPGETLSPQGGEYYSNPVGPAGSPRTGGREPPASGLAPPGGRYERPSTVASRPANTGRRVPAARPEIDTQKNQLEPPGGNLRPRPRTGTGSTSNSPGIRIQPRADATTDTTYQSPREQGTTRVVSSRRRAEPAGFVEVGPARETTNSSGAPIRRTKTSISSLRTRYGYDPDYRWLRGKLERLQASNRWKLRYIPIDGETDEFGGSVELIDSPALREFQSGDFVAIEGDLTGEGSDGLAYSPRYFVRHAESLSR